MTKDTSAELIRLVYLAQGGDEDAGARIIEENSGLIWSVVRHFLGRGTDAEDLYQLGCVGFIKALKGYDGAFETQFSTYAVPKIAGEIRRFLRDDGTVKVSRGLKEQAQLIRNARLRLEQKLGREPVLSELSHETGLSAEDIAVAETAGMAVDSLQRESGEDGLTLENALGTPGIEEGIVEKIALHEAVSDLPERERKVILLRYFKNLTQQQAARVLGISQVQVSRIERRAVESLREYMR